MANDRYRVVSFSQSKPGEAGYGGGAVSTDEGHRLLTAMRWLQSELERISRAAAATAKHEDLATFLSWRFVMKTSARNMLRCTVAEVKPGAVNSEIVLDIGGGKTIAAIITKESASTLGFKPGERASALIKASHIILAVE